METPKQIANRFRAVLLNGLWIANTNYKHLLSNLNWKEATMKIGSLNTIAALTYHIDYYIAGVLNVFEGKPLEIHDKYSFDLPPVTSEKDWKNILNKMWDNAEEFAKQVELMPAEKMNEVFVDQKYGNYQRNIEGIIEHSYYHLGQIALIKKMITDMKKKDGY